MKKQANFRLDTYAIELLKEFSERSGESQANLIQAAIYQLYYDYNRSDKNLFIAAAGYTSGKDFYDYKKLQKKVFEDK